MAVNSSRGSTPPPSPRITRIQMTRVQTVKPAAKGPGGRLGNEPARRAKDKPPSVAGRTRRGRPATIAQDPELDALLEGFELSQVVSHLLRRAHFRAEEIFAQEAGDRLRLTPRQKALLVSCYRNPGSNQSALAERIALDRNTAAEMVSRMVGTGLLVRSRDPRDARSNQVHITGKGVRMLKAIMPIDPVIEARVVQPLPPEYRPLFIKCLRLMAGLDPAGGNSSGAAGSSVAGTGDAGSSVAGSSLASSRVASSSVDSPGGHG